MKSKLQSMFRKEFQPEFQSEYQPAFVVVRKAESKDIEQIWDILHAECYDWDNEKIESNLSNLNVLLLNENIIGIMYSFEQIAQSPATWICVHPMYPEKPVVAIFQNSVSDMAFRQCGLKQIFANA